MNTSPDSITELADFVLQAVERHAPEGGLQPDEPLFGSDTRLGLDSLDALQLSMAIQKRYGVRMADSKETRRAFGSLAHLAEFLRAIGAAAKS